jgi:hypothetical protein
MLTEQQEQELLVEWLETRGYKFSALPLSTYTKSWAIKMRNKKMGVRAGVPDLMVIVKNQLIFIEMKREKRSVTSDFQKDWIEALNKCNGVGAFVCKGFDEARALIEKYSCPQGEKTQ